MKKILSVIICLLLLSGFAIPVLAAETAQMTVTASKTELNPGDKVTFTVAVSRVEKCTFGGFLFQFDKNVFSYESGKSLAGLNGFFAGVSTAANKVAGFFMNGVGDIEGDLFSVTLKVKDDAQPGTYTVTGRPSLSNSNEVECTAVGAQVTVGGTAAPDGVTPTAPDQVNPPVVDTTLDTDNDPLTGDIAVDAVGSEEENKHVEDESNQMPQKPAFPWWIVAAILVVAAGGAIFVIFEFRRTKKEQ